MESEYSSDNLLPDKRLPYPTRPLFFSDGSSVEEFIIPEDDKEIVLELLYPFSPIPKLTDTIYDLHADKTFTAREYRVTWEHGINYLVSPYYPESGGTVIDWMDENSWADDEFDEDDFDDVDFDISDTTDDDLPF